jgi:hypothetical protein
MGGPQSRSGRYGKVKILGPRGTRTPTRPLGRPARKPVAISTTLPRLLVVSPTFVRFVLFKIYQFNVRDVLIEISNGYFQTTDLEIVN